MPQVTLQQALDFAAELRKTGRAAEAESVYRQILAQQPNHLFTIETLAHIALQRGDPSSAEALLRRAIALKPDAAHLYGNLGMVLATSGRFDEAIAVFRQGLAIRPDVPETYNNLGNALREKGAFDEATAAYRRALESRPAFPDARWNLGLMLLMRGELQQGWPLYEARRDVTNFGLGGNLLGPQWDGSDPAGRTILLQSEQGFGDTIQFIRYARLLGDRGARVLLQTGPELQRFLSGQCNIERIISPGEPVPPFDFSSPLMTLPRLFGTTLQSIPADVPYLHPDLNAVEDWRRRLSELPPGLKVGLSWAGRPTHPGDRNRSIPPQALASLAGIPNVRWISLQKWKPATGDAPIPGMIDRTAELVDFADTAALIANLDLVITVDTAVAHLAGAMGRPVWLMLPFVPDWRWMLNRTDSPWYPTMRLFRQSQFGDWNGVIDRVVQTLQIGPPPAQ